LSSHPAFTTARSKSALAQADPDWLAGLITRQVSVGQWADAYDRKPDDIKTVLNFGPDRGNS